MSRADRVEGGRDRFEDAFWQAVDDVHAGTAKPIESYLRLVPSHERDELAAMLADMLLVRGPAPTPSAEESEGYARALAAIDDLLGTTGPAGVLPQALKTMRDARGIDFDDVVDHLAREFHVTSPAGRKSLERNYHSLERGKLLGSTVARRLMDSLARKFDIDVHDLLAGSAPTGEAPRMSATPAMGRSSGSGPSSRPDARSEAAAPDPEVELVERLFWGGRDA